MGHPLDFKNARIEVVVPALSALLSKSALYKLGDERPSLRPIFFNKFPDKIIFLVSPRLFP